MCRKLIYLVSFVLVLSLATSTYGSDIVGDFEQDLDGWVPTWLPVTPEMMTISATGATLHDRSLRLAAPSGWNWAIQRPLETEVAKVTSNNRIAFDFSMLASEWPGETYVKVEKIAFNGWGLGWQESTTLVSGDIEWGGPGEGDFHSRLVWNYSNINFSSLAPDPCYFYFALPVGSGSGKGGPVYFDNVVFFNSIFANEPSPANTQTGVSVETDLTWTKGDYAKYHDVYFGTSFAEVNDADNADPCGPTYVYRGRQPGNDTNYAIPETLTIDKTYYWRVDEVNNVRAPYLWKGEIWSFATAGKAKTPSPGDKATDVPLNVVLSWTSGPHAASHDVYFGTSSAEVDEANNTDPCGPTYVYRGRQPGNDTNYALETLDTSQTYYWRIDVVNAPSLWRGDIWQFTTKISEARYPYPGDKATDVPLDVVLSWTPGAFVDKHDVYFGTDETKVTDANRDNKLGVLVSQDQNEPNYAPPGLLDLSTTYYWRIDEVNGLDIWRSDVWSFTTVNYLIVDDFEKYPTEEQLPQTWYAWPGMVTSLNSDPNHSGSRSMKCLYSGSSEAEAVTGGGESELPIGPDWTEQGVKSITLYFYGDPNNDADVNMYVALAEASEGPPHAAQVTYGDNPGEDINDLMEAEWHEWNIDLADFNSAGVDLTNVQYVYIGFDGTPADGDDIVYFDDIRLYQSRCVPGRAKPAGDFDNNCDVDYNDLDVMTRQWLVGDYTANPLIAWYKLDGNAVDSSGHGNDGTAYGDPNWGTAGQIGTAIDLNGVNDYIDCSNDVSLDITDAITLAAWVKTRDCNNSEDNEYVAKGDTSYAIKHKSNNNIEFFIYDSGVWYTAWYDVHVVNFNNVWHHLAGTYDGSELKLYVDGALEATTAHIGSIATTTYNLNIGRNTQYPDRLYNGLIDDVRIYDRALSQAEIVTIKGGGDVTEFYHPIVSPTNLYDAEAQNSKVINFKDFAVLAGMWLEEQLWP
jgi:hypothetical protein